MKTLFKNRWLEIRELRHQMPDGSVNPYTSVLDGIGLSVAVLPWRRRADVVRYDGEIEVLLRREITPPWLVDSSDPSERVLSSLTGMVDPGEAPLEAAVRELFEEAGYPVAPEELKPLGVMRMSKVLETRIHTYAVDVTGLEPVEAPGDGGGFEEFAESVWCQDLLGTPDAVALAMYAKLKGVQGLSR